MSEIIDTLKQTGILDLLIVFGAGMIVVAVWHFDFPHKIISKIKKKGNL